MKRAIYCILAVSILLTGCVETVETDVREVNKRYFDSWIQVNYPELVGKSVFPGYYIVYDEPGSGDLIGSSTTSPYVRLKYTKRNLDGLITHSSYEKIARQTGTFLQSGYYGPEIVKRANGSLNVGMDEGMKTMRVGGKRQLIIPAWLWTTNRYASEEEYYSAEYEALNNIVDLEVIEAIRDINAWESDSLKRHMKLHFGYTDEQCRKDTLKKDFYKIVKVKPTPEKTFPKDTTVYINYTGRRLDGQVFDTTIADTAKVYGIYTSTKIYSPVAVSLSENVSEVKMNSSPVIKGFAYLLKSMGPFESAIGIFHSKYGYAGDGSAPSIPSFSPLRFDIEVVKKNK